MNNTINFAGRSNKYLAISKRGWGTSIPESAYKQINSNRHIFEEFARNHKISISFTDGSNMIDEFANKTESNLYEGKLAIIVKQLPSFTQRVKNTFLNIVGRFFDNKPKIESSLIGCYYEGQNKIIPTLKYSRSNKMAYFTNYKPFNSSQKECVDMSKIVGFLQSLVGDKTGKLSKIK